MKRTVTLLAVGFFFMLSVNAQYFYRPYTFMQKHTDHPGYNPGKLNNDGDYTYGTSLPGWISIDQGPAATPRWTAVQAIPFPFNFNGVPVTNFKVSTSGVLTFDTATVLAAPTIANVAIPSALIPDMSAMIWGLTSGSGDRILTKTFGTAPNRQLWIYFSSYSYASLSTSSCPAYWSIVLEESTDKIYMVDQRNSTSSSCQPTLTVGVQVNDSMAYSVSGSPNVGDNGGKSPWVDDNLFYEFDYGTKPAADLVLYALTIEKFKTPPANVSLTGKFINFGSAPVNAFDFKYDLNGTTYTKSFTGLNILPNTSYSFLHTDQVNIAAPGRYGIHAWVEQAGDVDQTNDSMFTATHGLSYTPTKKVLFEEGTGTWCGWCPRGAVYMDSLRSLYPNTTTLVAVHNGDPMTVTNYDAGMGYEIGGYPSGLVDRKNLDQDPSDFFTYYGQRINDKVPCEVDVQTSYDAITKVLTATVHAHFATELQGDYRFNAVVVEDDVTGLSASYAQANYYSGSTSTMVGAGHNWNASPDPIPAAQMEYDHVGRAILGGWQGTVGSLPAVIPDGSDQYYTYTYTLGTGHDPNTTHVIGWVCEPMTGNVFNSARSVGSIVGIPTPASNNFDVRVYPNPSSGNVKVSVDLVKNAKVSVEITDVMGRLVYANTQKSMSMGKYIYPVDLQALSNGLYNVKITVDDEQVTRRLILQQ